MIIFKKLPYWFAHCVLALTVLCASRLVFAEPLVYQLTGTGSGMLGSQVFDNAPLTITGIGDSFNVTEIDAGIFLNPLESVSISITGLGTGVTVDAFFFFVNQSAGSAGFIARSSGDVIEFEAAGLAALDGATPFGSLIVSSSFLAPFQTSQGELQLNHLDEASFAVTAVPEPSQWIMMLSGLLFMVGCGMKRNRRSSALRASNEEIK